MSLYEQILNTNLINFLIVIGTLALIFKKAHLGDLIEKMALDVKNNVEKSSLETKTALDEYKNIKKSMKDTPKLQEEIISSAKASAQNLKEKIEQKTLDSICEIKSNLEKIYASQNQKAKKSTLNEVYRSCVDLAIDEVKNNLNYETQKKLINLSIDEIDKIQGGV